MVVNSARTRLYGQRVYSGNLGEMGAYAVGSDSISLVDTNRYPPYPYGWSGSEPYVLSGNDLYLVYDNRLFNALDLAQLYGVFDENIHAISPDGRYAFGTASVWDTSTFQTSGDATWFEDMPTNNGLMKMSQDGRMLYVFNDATKVIYAVRLMLP